MRLLDKVIVITGGTGLLGIQHAEAVVEEGGIPILLDNDTQTVLKFKKDGKWIVKHVDITYEPEVELVCNYLIKKFGRIDGLINNACLNPKIEEPDSNFSALEDYDLDIFNKELEVSLTGSFLCTKWFGKYMAENGGGSIINIGSDLGLIGPDQRLYKTPKPISYSIVKSGLIGLTKYTATYWADKGVRCNYIALGGVQNDQPKEFVDKLNKLIPMGRMAKKDEYKGVIKFLLSEDSSYMTGSVISIDGGRTSW